MNVTAIPEERTDVDGNKKRKKLFGDERLHRKYVEKLSSLSSLTKACLCHRIDYLPTIHILHYYVNNKSIVLFVEPNLL